jgi:DNA-binding CsgD family transcriptional regulator
MVGLTPTDLEQNAQGLLSSRQKQALGQQRLIWIGGTIAFAGLALLIVGAIAWKIAQPTFAGQGQLFIGLPLGLFWLWLLRPAFGRWQQANQDLAEGQVASVDGLLHYGMSLSPGLWQQVRYEIELGGRQFRVNKATYQQLQDRGRYRVYYTPCSGLFLGAQPMDETEAKGGAAAPVVSPLIEPLKPQEVEILRLIAAGYANKEIAQELHLSVNTVKMYASQIYRKLEVERRTEAVARGRELGLL